MGLNTREYIWPHIKEAVSHNVFPSSKEEIAQSAAALSASFSGPESDEVKISNVLKAVANLTIAVIRPLSRFRDHDSNRPGRALIERLMQVPVNRELEIYGVTLQEYRRSAEDNFIKVLLADDLLTSQRVALGELAIFANRLRAGADSLNPHQTSANLEKVAAVGIGIMKAFDFMWAAQEGPIATAPIGTKPEAAAVLTPAPLLFPKSLKDVLADQSKLQSKPNGQAASPAQ